MRIAIDARMYGNEECTGIGTYIKNLTDNLFQIDSENEYVLFLAEPVFSKFVEPNGRVRKVKVTPRWYTYQEQFLLPLQFMKERFDLIHYPHFNSPILFPKKSICTIHDLTPLSFPGHKMKSTVRRLGYQAVFRSTILKSEKIIAISEATKQEIIKHFNVNPDKIIVTHEGVDERFKIIENCDIMNKEKNKFGIDQPFIFYVGVWRDHKNITGLVEAFDLLKKKYNLAHQLVLGGREDLHDTKVREKINASTFKNDIITTGYLSDEELPILYNSASVFVLPSFIEGFGLIAIEAQKCGCPVASSNSPALKEVLANSALFFNPHNVNEMAEIIQKILSDENSRQRLIKAGLENVSRFSWKKCAEQTLSVYQKILK